MTRREAILRVSALLGGAALVGQAVMLAGCGRPSGSAAVFSAGDIDYLDEIAETILPETGTPGAKAAGVGAFMGLMVTDAYYPNEQEIFRNGMAELEERCRDSTGTSFVRATAAQRLALLREADAEQFAYMKARGDDDDEPAHWFRMMKELALLGYFTSEIGYTQAMRYIETPGRYDPCAAYEPGEKAWAPHA